ncbi:MAG TPA: hypothetical protein OIL98_00575 [Lachnospiraceae bacterium]|nr:hypothetical protein [Lachnospiraceae bacterium]
MLTGLLKFKEKLKAFYAKGGIYIRYVCNFVLAFLSMFAMSRKIGGNGIISNPLICIALSIVCAFLPVNITVVIVTIYMIINLFTLSLELAMIALGVMVVIYLLYFRFAPKTGFIMILTPILFFLKLPYVVPVVAALTVGMTGIVPAVSGVFIYYIITFAANYSTAISTLDVNNALQNINFIFNNILTNKELVTIVVSFAVVITMIYFIKRLSVNYSAIIAVIAGCVTDALIQIIAFAVLSVNFSIIGMIAGHIAAIIVGLAINFFIMSVDYTATEYVQFEDDDYYYYVKAVPKMSVARKNVTIKKFNSSKDNRGAIHTESYEIDEDDE